MERERSGAESGGHRNRSERGAAILPLTVRSNALLMSERFIKYTRKQH